MFNPLQVAKDNIGFFDGREKDLDKECENVENFIRQHGGITIAILGLGMNGHIGMNEPGTSPALRSHVTDLASQTQKIGQKYFKKEATAFKRYYFRISNSYGSPQHNFIGKRPA